MSELVEPMARAIAAHKRRLPPDHPEIDRVWSSYCGQVRAALSAIEGRVRAEERERAARIAESFSQAMFERCAASGWDDDAASCIGWHAKNIATAIRSGDEG